MFVRFSFLLFIFFVLLVRFFYYTLHVNTVRTLKTLSGVFFLHLDIEKFLQSMEELFVIIVSFYRTIRFLGSVWNSLMSFVSSSYSPYLQPPQLLYFLYLSL